jgi:hypothetical protein
VRRRRYSQRFRDRDQVNCWRAGFFALLVMSAACRRGAVVDVGNDAQSTTITPSLATTSAKATATSIASNGPNDPPPATALKGVTQLQSLVATRSTSVRIETEPACKARMDRDSKQIDGAIKNIGDGRWGGRTRYASSAPHNGETIESVVEACLTQCVMHDDVATDRETIEMVRGDCQRASVALSDLADQLKGP